MVSWESLKCEALNQYCYFRSCVSDWRILAEDGLEITQKTWKLYKTCIKQIAARNKFNLIHFRPVNLLSCLAAAYLATLLLTGQDPTQGINDLKKYNLNFSFSVKLTTKPAGTSSHTLNCNFALSLNSGDTLELIDQLFSDEVSQLAWLIVGPLNFWPPTEWHITSSLGI